jgi:hypothetical protein
MQILPIYDFFIPAAGPEVMRENNNTSPPRSFRFARTLGNFDRGKRLLCRRTMA